MAELGVLLVPFAPMKSEKAATSSMLLAALLVTLGANRAGADGPATQTVETAKDVTRRVSDAADGLLDAAGLLGEAASPAVPTAEEVESAFLDLTNAERTARGLQPLALSDPLVDAARRQSVRMEAVGNIWHNNPGLLHEIAAWTALGENVGRGPTVDAIHEAFMASPEHRVNILDRGFSLVGFGAVVEPDGYIFVTEDFEEPSRRAEPVQEPQTVDVLVRLLAMDTP
jgi:uncharacterized protein YkwD